MSDEMDDTVFNRICILLDEADVAYVVRTHEPTRTSEDAARARNEDLSIGGKAVLIKVGDEFRLFVISASRRIDSRALRRHFGARKSRFATAEELHQLTGLVPGSVPPFGHPVLPLDLYIDRSIADNQRIAFNAGSLTTSIIMAVSDYLRVAQPMCIEFAAAED